MHTTSLFFFNDTATTEIYTLSLHDALPILDLHRGEEEAAAVGKRADRRRGGGRARRIELAEDRKSTRLNSSHVEISYAVFCLKKKKKTLLPIDIIRPTIYPPSIRVS